MKLFAEEEIQIFAHRGVSQDAPENTTTAYKKAIELGVGIEADVRVSKDAHPVCLHDAMLSRIANRRGLVRYCTLAELKQLDIGSWFGEDFAQERILTLTELFQLAKDKTCLAIEIKYMGTEELIARAVEETDMFEGVLVFDTVDAYEFPQRMKAYNPKIQTATCCICEEDYISLKDSGFQDVNIIWGWIYSGWLTRDIVLDIKQNGLKVVATIVNAEADMAKYVDLKVDGICTDRPKKLLNLIGNRKLS